MWTNKELSLNLCCSKCRIHEIPGSGLSSHQSEKCLTIDWLGSSSRLKCYGPERSQGIQLGLTALSLIRWLGVPIMTTHGSMAVHKNLELVEKRRHKFYNILYTLHSEASSYSYKSTILALKGTRKCHFGKRIILSGRPLRTSKHRGSSLPYPNYAV